MNILNKIVSLFKTKTDSNSVKPDSKKMLVSEELKNFLEDEVLDGLDINSDHFWSSLENIINEFAPRNKELLSKREKIQSQIDEWHINRKGTEHNHEEYKIFLKDIGYIVPDTGDF